MVLSAELSYHHKTRIGVNASLRRKDLNALPPAKLRFIEPMYARLVKELPEGPAWEYEIKFDGYRCLAGRKECGVVLWSRRGKALTHQFPEIALACERLKPDTLVDGEIIAIDENGRVSFNLLQNHRSSAAAVQFFAFDVIMCEGKSGLARTAEGSVQNFARGLFPNILHRLHPILISESKRDRQLVQYVDLYTIPCRNCLRWKPIISGYRMNCEHGYDAFFVVRRLIPRSPNRIARSIQVCALFHGHCSSV